MIVVEDENGNVVRETMKDNDVLQQYKTMRETLVYLCHLDYEDTETQMLDKLRLQVNNHTVRGEGREGWRAEEWKGVEGRGARRRRCWTS